jgi:NTP pyrophosphatase (non-canonical NTP hydrolase)
MNWLIAFSEAAAKTDRLVDNPNHVALLAVGLMGEIGSILAEVKKARRERDAYPVYRKKLLEETGDSLWYYIRLVSILDPKLVGTLDIRSESTQIERSTESLFTFLQLGEQVGALLAAINNESTGEFSSLLVKIWTVFLKMSRDINLPLQLAASENIQKIESRWPSQKNYAAFLMKVFQKKNNSPDSSTSNFGNVLEARKGR